MRVRPSLGPELKADVVALVRCGDRSLAGVCRDLAKMGGLV